MPKLLWISFVLWFILFACSGDNDSEPLYDLSADVVPVDAGFVSPNSGRFEAGQVLEVKAAAINGYIFSQWKGALSGNENPARLTMDEHKKITAEFVKKEFGLTIEITGEGAVNSSPDSGSGNYAAGVQVQLTAIPEEGWQFSRWETEGVARLTNPYEITMDMSKAITAVFEETNTENKSVYLALGDSYTIGQSVEESERWPVQLLDELKKTNASLETVKIIAQTGWRTDQLQRAMSESDLQGPYGLVSLLIGVNNQYQGLNAESFRSEFVELLERSISLSGNDKNRVFVVSIPDWGYTPYGSNFDRAKISSEIDQFNQVIKEEADLRQVKYFDITTISRLAINDSSLTADDTLHPSGKMYALWVEEIMKTLSEVDFD
jgi:lysophospholipase L1-like esterase